MLRDIGFHPAPARRPRSSAPGSIYHVSRNGKFYTTICRADKADVETALSRSPSEQMVARELQTVAYALDGKLAKLINAKLGSDVVEFGELFAARRRRARDPARQECGDRDCA